MSLHTVSPDALASCTAGCLLLIALSMWLPPTLALSGISSTVSFPVCCCLLVFKLMPFSYLRWHTSLLASLHLHAMGLPLQPLSSCSPPWSYLTHCVLASCTVGRLFFSLSLFMWLPHYTVEWSRLSTLSFLRVAYLLVAALPMPVFSPPGATIAAFVLNTAGVAAIFSFPYDANADLPWVKPATL